MATTQINITNPTFISGTISSSPPTGWDVVSGDPEWKNLDDSKGVASRHQDQGTDSSRLVWRGTTFSGGMALSQDYDLTADLTTGALDASPTGLKMTAILEYGYVFDQVENAGGLIFKIDFYNGDPSISPAPTLLSTLTSGTLTVNNGADFEYTLTGDIPTGARFIKITIDQTTNDLRGCTFRGVHVVASDQTETLRVTQMGVEIIGSLAAGSTPGSGATRKPRIVIAAG